MRISSCSIRIEVVIHSATWRTLRRETGTAEKKFHTERRGDHPLALLAIISWIRPYPEPYPSIDPKAMREAI